MRLRNVKTVEGGDVAVRSNGGVTVNESHVIGTGMLTGNGVIRVIDTVLTPKN